MLVVSCRGQCAAGLRRGLLLFVLEWEERAGSDEASLSREAGECLLFFFF